MSSPQNHQHSAPQKQSTDKYYYQKDPKIASRQYQSIFQEHPRIMKTPQQNAQYRPPRGDESRQQQQPHDHSQINHSYYPEKKPRQGEDSVINYQASRDHSQVIKSDYHSRQVNEPKQQQQQQQQKQPHTDSRQHLQPTRDTPIKYSRFENVTKPQQQQPTHNHKMGTPSHQHQGESGCSACYTQQLESDFNGLIAQLKHGEQCYDVLVQEAQTLRSQMGNAESANTRELQREIRELHQQMLDLKSAEQRNHEHDAQLKKAEIEQQREDQKELFRCRQEITQLRANMQALQDQLSHLKVHGEQNSSEQKRNEQMRSEQMLMQVADLNQALQSGRRENETLQDSIQKLKEETLNLRLTERDLQHQMLQEKDKLILSVRRSVTETSNLNNHKNEINFLSRENEELRNKLNHITKVNMPHQITNLSMMRASQDNRHIRYAPQN